MTHECWSKVYEMNIYEFFNIVAFSREYNRKMLQRANTKTVTYG